MTSEQKKTVLLLNFIILCHNNLNNDKIKNIEKTARELDGYKEFEWAHDFIKQDFVSSLERARDFFKNTIQTMDNQTRLSFLKQVWNACESKGYMAEMEAQYLFKISKDWNVQKEFVSMVK